MEMYVLMIMKLRFTCTASYVCYEMDECQPSQIAALLVSCIFNGSSSDMTVHI